MVQVIHFDNRIKIRGISERFNGIVDLGVDLGLMNLTSQSVVSDVTNNSQTHP